MRWNKRDKALQEMLRKCVWSKVLVRSKNEHGVGYRLPGGGPSIYVIVEGPGIIFRLNAEGNYEQCN